MVKDEKTLKEIRDRNLIAAQYSDEACKTPCFDYPLNPNGSIDAIAGICDSTGRVFGMMPHAEAYVHYTNHPRWTRGNVPEEGMGVAIFKNAVDYLKSNF